MDSLNWAKIYLLISIPSFLLGIFSENLWIFGLAIFGSVAAVFHLFSHITDKNILSIQKLERKIKKIERKK